MTLLSQKILHQIHAATLLAGLANRRHALLSGLDGSFAESLTITPSPADQILADLNNLNGAELLKDGSCPLATWLRNAALLSGNRREQATFEGALELLEQSGSEPRVSRVTKQGSFVGTISGPLTYASTPPHESSKPILKLLEVAENGIGAIARPMLLVLNAHAEGKARVIRETYNHRLHRLRSVHNRAIAPPASEQTIDECFEPEEADSLTIDKEEFDKSEAIATHVMETEQQAKRRANVVTIVAEAADSIANEVSLAPVHQDWTARFFSYAQDISDEEFQRLWGRILAGEVERPGKIPLRTLDTLRNLTRSEAALFREFISRLTIDGIYLSTGELRMPIGDIVTLQDAGLVDASVRALQWVLDAERLEKLTPQERTTIRHIRKLEFAYPSGHRIVLRDAAASDDIDVYIVRNSAFPIRDLIQVPTNVDYVRAAFKSIKRFGFFPWSTMEPPEEEKGA